MSNDQIYMTWNMFISPGLIVGLGFFVKKWFADLDKKLDQLDAEKASKEVCTIKHNAVDRKIDDACHKLIHHTHSDNGRVIVS